MNIHIMGVPKGEYRVKGTESIFKEIRAVNFLTLRKGMYIQVQKRSTKIRLLQGTL